MASGATDLFVSECCGIGESTVMDILQQVLPKFIGLFAHKIGWPQNPKGMQEVIDGFASWSSLHGVVGAVDGTEIRLQKLKVPNAVPYHNYKFKDHAMTLQAPCDSNRRFLAISSGCPNSFHDSRVLRLSGLYLGAQEGSLPPLRMPVQLLPTAPQLAAGHVDGQIVSTYIVGDKAYPCLPWLIGPFKVFRNRIMPPEERHFNQELTQAWLHVELSFQLLKVLWTSLAKEITFSHLFVPTWIHFACILHNLWLEAQDICFPDEERQIEENMRRFALQEDIEILPEVPALVGEGTGAKKGNCFVSMYGITVRQKTEDACRWTGLTY